MSTDFVARHLRYRLVDDPRTLGHVHRQLEARREAGGLRSVAVDFEFSGRSERQLEIRLLQLGLEAHERFPEEQLLLDASKIDVRPFAELFVDETVEKIMHAPHSDYQRWFEHMGARSDADAARLRFQNVYDTAQHLGLVQAALAEQGDERAATLLGWAGKSQIERGPTGYSVSLATFAAEGLGLAWSTKKSHWSDKWMAERLSERQLETAALDVAALPELKGLLAPFEQELTAQGLDLAREARELDDRIFELARDLALVPFGRREALRELVSALAVEAAQGDGTRELGELSPAEHRVLVKDFSRPRARNYFTRTVQGELVEEEGRLVVRALTAERRRELSLLAERLRQGDEEMPKLQPLEEKMVTSYLRRRSPEPVLEH